jgi:hypothetical protein
MAKLKSTLNPQKFKNIQSFMRQEEVLQKIEMEETGGGTSNTLKKKEIIN